MNDTLTTAPADRLKGAGLALAYLFLSLVWILALQIAIGIGFAVWAIAAGIELSPDALELPVGLLAGATIIQLAGLAALGAGLAWVAGWPLRRSFALAAPPVGVTVVAGIGALSVGFLPGWIAQTIRELLPSLEVFGSLAMISDALRDGPLWGRVLMVLAVCVAAPLFEEVAFRGYLWDALDRSLPTWLVWLTTSGVFAMYHIDPIHVLSVWFTGLFLGWLRWMGGSVWPAVLAHFVNNTLAVAFTLGSPPDDDTLLPLWVALVGAAFTGLMAGLGFVFRRRM